MPPKADSSPIVRGFATLLRGSLRRGQPDDASLTAYIKQLFGEAEISERTIWRLLESESWPTRDAIDKLSDVLPAFAWATSDSETLRGCWKVAWLDQLNLPDRSTITILAASEDPKALDNRGIAESLAHNILAKGCRYIFLFPPYPEQDLASVRVRLAGAVLTAIGGLTQGGAILELGAPEDWYKRIIDSIHVFRTRDTPQSWEMWGNAPNYAVLYNACAPNTELFPKYGMYWSKGISIYSSPLSPEPERVSGWEFLDIAESNQLFGFIESPENHVIVQQDFAQWPLPGNSPA